ncbi:MAG: EamA family transporter, partial [Acidimicrobiia bacterium]
SGASLVWVRRIAVRHDPMTVLAPMMAGAAVVTGIASGLGGYPPWSPQVDAGELAQLVAMGVLGVLTYLSALKASQLAPASRVGLMGYLVPLVGVTGGVLLFAEPFTGRLALGGLLVLGGVALVGWQNRRVAITTAG